MSGQLQVYLNKVTMVVKKDRQECAMEFAATIARGTWRELLADEAQFAALPTELATACRQVLENALFKQAALREVEVARLAMDGSTAGPALAWERTILLEGVQVRKQEDRDLTANARLSFQVKLEQGDRWPGRDLVGKWVRLSLHEQRKQSPNQDGRAEEVPMESGQAPTQNARRGMVGAEANP
mgnify:CR=1 FL=1